MREALFIAGEARETNFAPPPPEQILATFIVPNLQLSKIKEGGGATLV